MSTTTRITLEQYNEMIRQGVFEPREERRVELLYGEISPVNPIGLLHDDVVDELVEWTMSCMPARTIRVRVQGSLGIPSLDSVPQPGLVWLRRKSYAKQRPAPDDVLLLIEVADSSVAMDRGLKVELHASAGIRDCWIVNLQERCIEVRRDPKGAEYRSLEVILHGQEVRPLEFAELSLPVSQLFPD